MLVRSKWMGLVLAAAVALGGAGCGDDDGGDTDAGNDDAGPRDAGMRDAGPPPSDSGPPDAGPPACTTGCGIVEVSAGSNHSCARRENGTVLCWGRNYDGQLGDNRMRHENCGGGGEFQDCSGVPVVVLGIDDAAEISLHGGPSSCSRDMAGQVSCWGLEWADNPAFGGPEQHFEPFDVMGLADAIDIGNGNRHLCAVRAGGEVACLGTNNAGQLGDGTRMDRFMPVTVLGPAPLSTEPLAGVLDVEVSPGGATSCARTADAVYCWGSNANRQFADGMPVHEACMSGLMTFDCSTRAVQVAGLTDATQIAVGVNHVCAVKADATVVCWGANHYGQLGDGTTMDRDVPTAVMGITDAAEVAAGADFTCVRRTTGAVSCFGSNDRGRLGDGDMEHTSCVFGGERVDCSSSPVEVMGLADATQIAAGSSHTCALRMSGDVVCWGVNGMKQLGDRTMNDSYAPVMVNGLD